VVVSRFALVSGLAALLWACGSAPPPPKKEAPKPATGGLPVTADDVCTVHCDRAEKCGVHRDACERDCPGRGRPIAKMRADFVGRLMLCLEGAACASLTEGTAWRGCHEAIVKTLPVTKPLRKFCFESARRAARCGRGDEADQMACLTEFRYSSDAALEAARQCMDQPCDDVPACMTATLTR
jgi:hypothetical protein